MLNLNIGVELFVYQSTDGGNMNIYLFALKLDGLFQVLLPDMSLATVRAYVWKKPEDLVLHYRVMQGR